MTEFFQTVMGHKFYERDVPHIADQLFRIANALNKLTETPDECPSCGWNKTKKLYSWDGSGGTPSQAVRRPTNEEMDMLVEAYAKEYGEEVVTDLDQAYIAVFPGYITGGPGYFGRVVVVVYDGAPSMFDVYTERKEDGKVFFVKEEKENQPTQTIFCELLNCVHNNQEGKCTMDDIHLEWNRLSKEMRCADYQSGTTGQIDPTVPCRGKNQK